MVHSSKRSRNQPKEKNVNPFQSTQKCNDVLNKDCQRKVTGNIILPFLILNVSN